MLFWCSEPGLLNMAIAEQPQSIQICRGKHCRKFEAAHLLIRGQLPDATESPCFGICKGPVV